MLEFNATILAQIVDFVILLIFLRLVVYKPLCRLLANRSDHIANSIAAAEQERQEAEQLKAGYEAEMRRAREQAQEIVQKATRAGEDQALQIVSNAKNEAEKLKENAHAEIEREKQRAIAELRDQVATLSVLVAGKIIHKTISKDIQRSMIDDFIKEAGELQ
ncbi:MAG: ATP synthase subunit b, sodium ion specific [Firmicutes bacterium ADurb.Bin373]|nr:F0F1 ATP synthase subunit B [Bacillota bacterium]OQA07662.1 MAG: ATP synthase subunit b, sodium ion specific [Firmicutes bacterium ADurb.Bin373]